MSRSDLSRYRAMVTGASSGLGAEFARVLAERNVGELILVARRRNRLDALAGELARTGTPCTVEAVDLSDRQAVAGLVDRHPDVDLLVNNAGFGSARPVLDEDPDWLLRMVDLNCRAVLHLSRAWLPGMVARRSGGILFVGSTAGVVPLPTMAVYAATKAFLNSLATSLRSEVHGTGVRIHLLTPGPVHTEFFEVARPGMMEVSGVLVEEPREVARLGVEAWLADREHIVTGPHGRLWTLIMGWMPPNVSTSLLRRTGRLAHTQLGTRSRKALDDGAPPGTP